MFTIEENHQRYSNEVSESTFLSKTIIQKYRKHYLIASFYAESI